MGGQYMSHVYNKSNEDIKISVTIAIPKTPDSVSIILMKPGEKKRFECGDKKQGKVTVAVYKDINTI